MKGDAMTLPGRLLVIAVFILSCRLSTSGQTQPACLAPQDLSSPCIDKIDPPDWWAGMPAPMLLVHGQGLNHARFTLRGTGVTLDRTQASTNGHWAFLWLETKSAPPQTLWITARNDQGEVRHAYVLAKRSHDVRGHLGFSSADILYLIMTDRFADGNADNDPPSDNRASPRNWHGGDLAGIEQHLDYLQQLGVTAVWTTPVASNEGMRGSYHGYAATDLSAVDPHFGTLGDYQHLSDALHARGMKLVIDLVPNHIGVSHPWVQDPPAPDWLHGTVEHHRAAQHDFLELVDPHAPPQAWRDITDGWFTDAMPDLNQQNPLVERYLIQNALWWVEAANLDGIRLDTFPYVDRAFWHEFHSALHSVYPHLTTVGEIFNRDAEVTSFFAGGVSHAGIDTGLSTPFDFPVYFALRDVLAHGQPMTQLATVLRQDALYPHPERLVSFIGNHDTTRFVTEAEGSVPKLKLALGLVATLRGTPQIYSGDEIGMPGGKDPDDRHDFPGGFAGDAHNAFTKAGRTAAEEDVFSWISGLLALRAEHPALQSGLEQNLFADQDLFAFVRSPDGTGCAPDHSAAPARDRILVVANKAAMSKALDLSVEETALAGCTEFHALDPARANVLAVAGGKLHIDEPAESMTVFAVH
jgi:glycosidase